MSAGFQTWSSSLWTSTTSPSQEARSNLESDTELEPVIFTTCSCIQENEWVWLICNTWDSCYCTDRRGSAQTIFLHSKASASHHLIQFRQGGKVAKCTSVRENYFLEKKEIKNSEMLVRCSYDWATGALAFGALVASYPGSQWEGGRGGKAWYPLFAHAINFPEMLVNWELLSTT